MGIHERLGFVTGQRQDIGPGTHWPRLIELISGLEQPDENRISDHGRLAADMVISELADQGMDAAMLPKDTWASIGERFAAGAEYTRTEQCQFLDEGFMELSATRVMDDLAQAIQLARYGEVS